MTNHIALAGSLVLLASPVAAQAADLVVAAPDATVATSTVDWSGAYLGVQAGLGSGYVYNTEYEDEGTDLDGSLAGVQAGYNVQIDNFVLGVAGDVNWSNLGFEVDQPPAIEAIYTAQWLATLRARAGVALDGILLYGTAGLGVAGTSYDLVTTVPATIDQVVDATHIGWVAGLGAEVMVTDSISLGAEYLHYELGAATYEFDGVPPFDVALRADTFTVGANFHF